MRAVLALAWLPFAVLVPFAGCSSSGGSGGATGSDAGDQGDAAAAGEGGGGDAGSEAGTKPQSKIEHVVVIVQENHTFDAYFGKYCTAATGSSPTCTAGPACCEAGPDKEPGGASPAVLDDTLNGARDPDHSTTCETAEVNGGKMDGFVTGASCSNPQNFAYADPAAVKPYRDMAAAGALADRYFQPIIGQSSSNDMFFARAGFVFTDNAVVPASVGRGCSLVGKTAEYTDKTIADLLLARGATFAWYGEGYAKMKAANGGCPDAPPECGAAAAIYPCIYDPGDVPFQFYPSLRDKPEIMRDLAQLDTDLGGATLPAVSFVKGLGYKTEHPGFSDKVSVGAAFVKGIADKVAASPFAASTLVLVTFDEGGGFFDHVAPPPTVVSDGKPYGTRVPMLALGPFAKKNEVSHVVMEHSSIVKFIEWNWLGDTGQLGTRDREVNNLGSLLDPAATGVAVPEK
jgi:phospholipase C